MQNTKERLKKAKEKTDSVKFFFYTLSIGNERTKIRNQKPKIVKMLSTKKSENQGKSSSSESPTIRLSVLGQFTNGNS